jgi:hypothetical protein
MSPATEGIREPTPNSGRCCDLFTIVESKRYSAAKRLVSLIFAICAAGRAAERPEIGVRLAFPTTATVTVEDLPYANNQFACGPDHPGQICGTFESAARRPMFGLSILFPVTDVIAVRVSPLYQRFRADTQWNIPYAPGGGVRFGETFVGTDRMVTTAHRWELPVSAVWKVTRHIHAGIGATVSTMAKERTVFTIVEPPNVGGSTYRYGVQRLSRRSIGGVTADIEFPFGTRFGTIAPDVQFTRWLSRHYGERWPLNRLTLGLAVRF